MDDYRIREMIANNQENKKAILKQPFQMKRKNIGFAFVLYKNPN